MGTKMEKLLHFVQPRLEDGEVVRATVSGSCDAKVDGDGVRSALLVATDRRVIALSKKLSGCTLDSVRYDEVSSLEQGKNLMGHSLAFRSLDHNLTLKWIVDLADLAEFAAFVKPRIAGQVDATSAHLAADPDARLDAATFTDPTLADPTLADPTLAAKSLLARSTALSDASTPADHPLGSAALFQLAELRDSGGLTDDEFETTKAELIARH